MTICDKIILRFVRSGHFNIDKNGRIWDKKGNRAERQTEKDGYWSIRKMLKGRRYTACSHRIVYLFFKGRIPKHYEINHKDGKKYNNHPRNLETGTKSYNIKHAFKLGLKNQNGEKNPVVKLTDKQIDKIFKLYATKKFTMEEIGKKVGGICFQHISRIIRGERRNMDKKFTIDKKDHRNCRYLLRDSLGRFFRRENKKHGGFRL